MVNKKTLVKSSEILTNFQKIIDLFLSVYAKKIDHWGAENVKKLCVCNAWFLLVNANLGNKISRQIDPPAANDLALSTPKVGIVELCGMVGSFAESQIMQIKVDSIEAVFKYSPTPHKIYSPVCLVPADTLGVEAHTDSNKNVIIHRAGEWIIRAGPRKNDFNFYTPEALAFTLSTLTTKERCRGLSSSQIRRLSINEPSVGTGALLIAGALALYRSYQSAGGGLPEPEFVTDFLRHNVSGVDLNPVSIEMAKISLDAVCAYYDNGGTSIGFSG